MVVGLYAKLRARIKQMAEEQVAMQERLFRLPQSAAKDQLDRMERHATVFAGLTSRLGKIMEQGENAAPCTAWTCLIAKTRSTAHAGSAEPQFDPSSA